MQKISMQVSQRVKLQKKRQQRTAFPAKKEHDRRGKYLAKKEGRLSKEGEEFERIF